MGNPKTFREFLERCHQEDPDFGKVLNTDPKTQFAFSLKKEIKLLNVAKMTLQKAMEDIVTYNDFGGVESFVPLSKTSYEVSLGIDEVDFEFSCEDSDTIPAAEFIWRISKHVVDNVLKNPREFGLECSVDSIRKLRFYRFYFCENDGEWEVIWG